MTEATKTVSTRFCDYSHSYSWGHRGDCTAMQETPEADAEESALFQKWLASDIARNEKKFKLMQLQEEKTKLQISKLQRELQLE